MTNHICRRTRVSFEITEEDLSLYDRLSPVIGGKKYSIPPPLLCPGERERRRLAYRNEHKLHHRSSSLSGTPIISFFHNDSPYTVYSHEEWWSDKWDPMAYGQTFDAQRDFFAQFHSLQRKVPRPPLVNNNASNSNFCNFADDNKNCYLLTSANDNEDSYYGFLMVDCKNAVDCLWCMNCELVYECVDCQRCYDVQFAQNCNDCRESSFLYDCKSVSNSMLCIGLRKKQHCILNEQRSKEEYERLLSDIRGSYSKQQEYLGKYKQLKREHTLRQANHFIASQNCTGDNIYNSHNIHHGFDVFESQDCAYLHDGLKANNCADICFFDGTELCYESTSLMGYGYRFTTYCRDSSDLLYCDNCHGCRNCFGCIGLRKKQYCILNRQYTQQEYEERVAVIINHMMQEGTWGEFFPIEHSPFAYNETLAQDYFPLEKQRALDAKWQWRDEVHDVPQVEKVIPAALLPDTIAAMPDDVHNWAIECIVTKKPFKIIPQELRFYREHWLPLPRLHPDERRRRRIVQRNPRKLWNRQCANCQKPIATTYAPERKERVVCESCYLAQVY